MQRTRRTQRMGAITIVVVALGLVAGFAPPARATNDPKWKDQYGPVQIQAHAAWNKTKGERVIIAVVDTGVDNDHPDLKAKLLPGRDFASNDNNADDDAKDDIGVRGHGTHVAGIAAAITDNGEGVAGVAPLAQILPVKVFPSTRNDQSGGTIGPLSNSVIEGIRWSVDQGAKVINLSLGTLQGGINLVGIIETPCFEAFQRGALCVVAAGNSGKGRPSGYQREVFFLNVTANDADRNRAGFGQNADTKWAVSAPGVDILNTVPVEDGKYGRKQGTSMAAPHAAGAAALLFAQGLTNQQVVDRLRQTATPSQDPGMGSGIINVGAAAGAAPLPDDRFTTATTKKTAAASATGPTATRPKGSGGSGLEESSGAGADAKRGLPGEAANNAGEFDFTDPAGGEQVPLEEAGSDREKAKGVSDTTMLGVLAGFLLLGVVIPVGQAWSRRSLPR